MWKYVTLLFLPALVRSDISRVSVVCPEVAVPGQSTAVLVSLHQRDEINVTLRLVSVSSTTFTSRDLLAYNTMRITGEGTIGVPVPSHAQGEVSLETFVDCDFDQRSCHPQVTCYLRLVGSVRDVIIRPKSKYYKPGETVEFWVLAVDHDLRVASDITASIHLIDPSNTKAAMWEQVSLDQDTKKFAVPLSRRTSLGIWRIEVRIEENVFSSKLNVSRERGCNDPVTPELSIAEEHFVELRFTKEMRRRYKPGLPFVGKLYRRASETGSLGIRQRAELRQTGDPNNEQNVLAAVAADPTTSTRRIGLALQIPHVRVHRVLRGHGFHPFHLTPVQNLLPTDGDRRVEFCQWYLDHFPYRGDRILWTDEATFTRRGIFNMRNSHVYAHENPDATITSHYQHEFRVNIWMGMMRGQLIGPLEIPPRLNAAGFVEVEAVSSEKAVRVRVKVLDNTTSIYSQDIEMAAGIGSFLVPAVLSDSEQLILQAELVSVEGKEIDSHYVLAREPIYKWNSSSSCYLLVEEIDETLKPGDTAHPAVLSSCPCDSHLHYIVTTEGHLTFWDNGAVPSYDLPPKMEIGKPSLCRFNITFKVDTSMAPVSHLLVYYVTDDGEPISDVVSFNVRMLQNQVTLHLKPKNYWNPDDVIDLRLITDHDAYTCVMGGRGGEVHSRAKSGGVELDFTEAGVGFHQWSLDGMMKDLESTVSKYHRSISSDIELEQLWLWQCFNYSAEVELNGLQIHAPSEPGKWTLMALSISPSLGLRYSVPLLLQVFRQLDVDFKMPPSIRVGESLEVDIKIGNNLNSCVDVSALLTLTEGAHFQGSSQPFVAEKLRLGPHGATSLVVRVVASTPGRKNMTVEVSAYHSDTCQSVASETVVNHSLVGTIVKHQSITVNPEGLVKTHIESAYFCANEQMVISTPEDFRYELIPAPRNREGVVFEVRAGKGVHIALSEEQDLSQKMYQIVIGDQENTVSWLGRGKHGYSVHLTSASTPEILSSDQSKTFWLSWDRGAISLGLGSAVHEKRILKWKMDKTMKIEFIGFATTWGQPAEFRIWNFNDEAGYSQVIHLDIPHSLLPGSETGTLLVAGGLHLPYLADRIRPSLSEFSSLSTVLSTIASQLSSDLLDKTSNTLNKEDSFAEIKTSLQNLMLYRRKDGSFSDHSYASSHWSTVEVLDLLSRAQSAVSIDTFVLTSAKKWIQNRQQADGSFKDTLTDVFPDNLTWIDEPARTISTTASTLICLVNIGLENERDSEVVMKARRFLESYVRSDVPLDSVTLSALCYSLVKSRSDKISYILERLRNVSTNDEGEFGWPHQRENSDWLYEEGVEQKKQPVLSHLREFKASLYALMTYTALNDLKSAEPVARYLFYRSNLLDTHTELINMAVKAFSEFGRLALDENRWLTVSLATSGMELTDTLELKAASEPQLLNLPSLPTKVFIYATGGGCATVQGRISYATYSTSKSNTHLDLWAGVIDEVMPKRNSIQELEGKLPMLHLKTCFRWKGPRPPGIIRVEIHLFSGFELVDVTPNSVPMDYGSFGDQIWFAVSNVSMNCAVCIDFSTRSEFIINRLRPGLARAYPSGRPDLVSELFFHAHRGSSLLAGTSEDDLITWFGASTADDIQEFETTFSDACMCNKSCSTSTPVSTASPTSSPDDEERQNDEISDFTDIIVFSNLREDLSTTQADFGRVEGLVRDVNGSTSHDKTAGNHSHEQVEAVVPTAASIPQLHHLSTELQKTKFSIHSSVKPEIRSSNIEKESDSLLSVGASTPSDAYNREMSSPNGSAGSSITTVLTQIEKLKPLVSTSPPRLYQRLSSPQSKTEVRPSFDIHTGEETVNTELKMNLKDIVANSFHEALLRPFDSAKLAKVRTSGLLKDSRALGG